jgi:hypothetical protein
MVDEYSGETKYLVSGMPPITWFRPKLKNPVWVDNLTQKSIKCSDWQYFLSPHLKSGTPTLLPKIG